MGGDKRSRPRSGKPGRSEKEVGLVDQRERGSCGFLQDSNLPPGKDYRPHQPPYTTEDKLQNDPSQPPMTKGGGGGRSSQLLINCSRFSLIKKDL